MTDPLALLTTAAWAATKAATPEQAINAPIRILWEVVGDREAHLRQGALDEGQSQFFVGGAFFVTPDRKHQMLIGSIGFPSEQRRLLIPIDGGHPGRVIARGEPLLLEDTRKHPAFQQYLKTARMSSAIYAPLIWDGAPRGLIILAAQAGDTMRDSDLALLKALAPTVTANWLRLNGPAWFEAEYAMVAKI
ncbi:MAG: GAF domain-containing protein [Rhodobacterales bacterium]|nr:GAF domain-containing protein [Rhodobacterales bacterium]